MVAERPPEGAAGTSKAPPAVAHPDDPDVSSEVYLGVVKSYNDRRGFGFLACTETANQYGRDVYMPKAEATLAALQAAGVDRDTGAAMVASGNTSAAAAAAAAAAIGGGPEAAKAAAAAAAQPAEGEKAPLAPRLAEEVQDARILGIWTEGAAVFAGDEEPSACHNRGSQWKAA
eukprot:TRINITY_DN10755_c1_g1_i2.p1 TRINITY_DN10755_c1_g1~~TRINITY_DN10755_c1_g1_i2.p1  ORF type:complete len:174 (+),score=45.64 TRINITY_DN10755_c1_g1_i2:65-586(+)